MALWVCADCSTAYAVGLPACPHCLSVDHREEEPVPKNTVHGGPTNAYEDQPDPDVIPDDEPETTEEESSPGNSSETSSTKPLSSPKKSSSAARSRARTTESPS